MISPTHGAFGVHARIGTFSFPCGQALVRDKLCETVQEVAQLLAHRLVANRSALVKHLVRTRHHQTPAVM